MIMDILLLGRAIMPWLYCFTWPIKLQLNTLEAAAVEKPRSGPYGYTSGFV